MTAHVLALEPEWVRRAADDEGWAWARHAWRSAARVPGAWFDAAKADAVVARWPTWFKLTDDRFAGQPFYLSFWQEVTVRLLVGWKHPVEVLNPATGKNYFEHVRLFRRLDLWIPRKNGKSEFLAALALLFWAIEGVVGGQGFCFARDEKQGRVIYDKMAAILLQNPDLAKEIAVYKKSMWIGSRRASFELLPGKAEGKHGRSSTVTVGDEMHEWRSAELSTILRQSSGARMQPIELYASTAGLKTARVGYGLFEEALAVAEGRMESPTTLVVMFVASDEDDWTDEAVWRRVNPNLGLSPTINYLRGEFEIGKKSPSKESFFRRYHLNQWVDASSRWLPLDKWGECGLLADWRTRETALRGKPAFGGLDISSTRDITALTWWFPPDETCDQVRSIHKFWVPQAAVLRRRDEGFADYDGWIKAGALISTPGDYVDQSFVQRAIEEGFDAFDVQGLGVDPWNATKLITDLQNAGVSHEKIIKVRQGFHTLAGPTRHFEELVFQGKIDHGGHPVMHWMGRHAMVRHDRNMNFIPDKATSAEKIDGIGATVNAAAVALNHVAPAKSVYETRGALIY